jgi:hypothetical protein
LALAFQEFEQQPDLPVHSVVLLDIISLFEIRLGLPFPATRRFLAYKNPQELVHDKQRRIFPVLKIWLELKYAPTGNSYGALLYEKHNYSQRPNCYSC